MQLAASEGPIALRHCLSTILPSLNYQQVRLLSMAWPMDYRRLRPKETTTYLGIYEHYVRLKPIPHTTCRTWIKKRLVSYN